MDSDQPKLNSITLAKYIEEMGLNDKFEKWEEAQKPEAEASSLSDLLACAEYHELRALIDLWKNSALNFREAETLINLLIVDNDRLERHQTTQADVTLNDLLCAERKAKAFDFIQEHATRIHFDEACGSLIYSDKDHFTKDDWLLKAIEKASA